MKKTVQIIAICLVAFTSKAQQDPMLTQYMFNGMVLNPAYAGSHEYWSSTMTVRGQWVGAEFDGAPTTVVASVDGPIRGKNMGLGFNVGYDQLGVSRTTLAMANYAYQLRLNQNTRLAFGVSAGVSQYVADVQEVVKWDENDVVYANTRTATLPRAGFGSYLFTDNFYVGVSIPTLLAYEDGQNFSVDLSKASFLRRHYLLTGGVVLPVSEKVKFKPSILLKYVKNAPLEADINFSTVFQDAFWIGASYRTNDAVAVIVQYQTNSYFRIGYSYDLTVSGLRNYQSGSHEIMIGVDFGKDLKKIKTPRYF